MLLLWFAIYSAKDKAQVLNRQRTICATGDQQAQSVDLSVHQTTVTADSVQNQSIHQSVVQSVVGLSSESTVIQTDIRPPEKAINNSSVGQSESTISATVNNSTPMIN